METGEAVGLEVTAVVGDRLPLLCAGLRATLRRAGAGRIEQRDTGVGALDAAGPGTGLVVAGLAGDDLDLVARKTSRVAARVVVLVDQLDRPALVRLLDAGVAGFALRSVTPEDLVGMVRAILRGERAVAPPLLSVLVGFDGLDEVRTAASGRATATLDGAGGSLLTAREQLVLGRLVRGESNAAIAEALYISPATVKSHLTSIYAKLEVGSRLEAASRAVALGLLD